MEEEMNDIEWWQYLVGLIVHEAGSVVIKKSALEVDLGGFNIALSRDEDQNILIDLVEAE